MPSTEEDEALARALQQEFQRDYERQSARRSQRPPNAAPGDGATLPTLTTNAATDDEVARRLEQEEKEGELARRMDRDQARRRQRRSNMARKSRSQQQQDSAGPAGRSAAPRSEATAAVRDDPLPPQPPTPTAPLETEVQTEGSGNSGSTPVRGETRRSPSRKAPLNDVPASVRRSSHRKFGSRPDLSSSHSRRGVEAGVSRSGHKRSDSVRESRSSTGRSSAQPIDPNQANHVSTSSPAVATSSHQNGQLSTSRHSAISTTTEKDLELARRLEQEEKDEELARRLGGEEQMPVVSLNDASAHSQRNKDFLSRSSHHQRSQRSSALLNASSHSMRDSTRSSPPTVSSGVEDVEVAEIARKLDQEERDEELARSIVRQEQARSRRRMTIYEEQDPASGRRGRCTLRRVLSLGVPLVVIVAAAVGLVIAFTGGADSLFGVDAFGETDPFDGENPDEANRWRNDGDGLELTVMNALEADWESYFNVAINDWDFGTPDTLTLTTEKVAPESECKPVQGKMKVCDGNYGDTRWRGINQVLLTNGWIIASVAKLNEYYLGTSDTAQRAYTMCHEIGHGFGLPHTDENFYNADLGNCMDYTTNPEVNQKPDDTNYAFLEDLYGVVPDAGVRGRRISSALQIPASLPDDLMVAYEDAEQELALGSSTTRGWSLLHKSPHGEAHSKDLGNGFTLQVYMLMNVED